MERSILITGCSSGIGNHCALGLKARGWHVLATVRNEIDRSRLQDLGLDVCIMDYMDPHSIAECADWALSKSGGKLFALFNNGAHGQTGAVEDLPMVALRAQFEANFFGWHDLTCRLIPTMRANKAGRIVQCSSVLGLVTMKFRGAYSASKFAIEALSETMAMELEGTGIWVCQIEPGPIASKFVEHVIEHFDANIDWQNSPHRDVYERRRIKMQQGGANRFKLGPEAVLEKLVHALESPNPKPRYYVTTPTHLIAALRRIMPNRTLRAFLTRQSNRELPKN